MVAFRQQEKRRHSFLFDSCMIEIDTWPKISTYVEIEGSSKEKIKEVSEKLGLNWNDVEYRNPARVLEEIYKIPFRDYRYFTFDKIGQ
ncbi:hypothetical protein ACFLY7_00230 [Patescibacteria group bacterium]